MTGRKQDSKCNMDVELAILMDLNYYNGIEWL